MSNFLTHLLATIGALIELLWPIVKVVVVILALVALFKIAGSLDALASDFHGSLWGNVFHVVTN